MTVSPASAQSAPENLPHKPASGITALLAEYARLARDTHEKGLLFERLIAQFLRTDPLYSARFDEVWLWQDWPGRDGKVDTGIDLVARERYTGKLCAIQCKFYASDHYLQKSDIDSFFTASGKAGFSSRAIVSTTNRWSKHAEDAIADQQINTFRIGLDELEASDIDWSQFSIEQPEQMHREPLKELREHQLEALRDVKAGFDNADRGKLIMACGTGKTFTSLRIAEQLTPPGGSVLFLVPSIALLSQTLREWAAQQVLPQRAFAICSDTKVGKRSEDYSVSDLAFPATTNAVSLLAAANEGGPDDGLTVYFSTYQSIGVVADAQQSGLPAFDLVICDEAHRTTGVTLAGDAESAFVRVHDENYIRTRKRLYMTATPKLYGDAVKSKASEKLAVVVSMDDESRFGPTFHRLGFGAAVERGLLSDYRVLVLAVDEGAIGANFQQEFAQQGELNIPDAARIVGIYNGLAKRGVQGLGPWPGDIAPMRRAVAFSRSIKDSQKVSSMLDGFAGGPVASGVPAFPTTTEQERLDEATENADASGRAIAAKATAQPLGIRSQHVDGTMNVLVRNEKLDWLKAETDADENSCRILTNARCLSEGVDVPALDAVIFLNSRDSQVDVVQSVGRVMRRAEGKDYGYIILPIAVPAGESPEQALNDNAKYKVVWDVLRALRAHDERFEAKIEQLDLNRRSDDQIQAIAVTDWHRDGEGAGHDSPDSMSVPLNWAALGADWTDAIYAKIVDKVGERDYWENWARNVAEIAARQQARIRNLVTGSDERIRTEFQAFVGGLQDNLNPSITDKDAIEALSQHLITLPVFDALFQDYSFSDNNPVSQVMQRMVDALEGTNVASERDELDAFYASVRRTVSGITDVAGKQTTIKRLYEKFFSGAFRDTSNRLGIVYTPNEIVDFILHSADDLLRSEFGTSLSDEGVHVLDPFTGTGTFIVRLLQSGLIKASDLVRKYRYELHANEIVLLAYYVAAVNIEETFHGIVGASRGAHAEHYETDRYEPFPGIVLTDTFQSSEDDDELDDHGVFGDNNDRVKAQNALKIHVIVGNPPYSSGQDSANDNNQNLKYPYLDKRIAETYAARSTATLKNSLYDSYIRAIRWASDRIGDRGIVAFVSNGGFLDGNTADGLRKSLTDEFSSLYVFNLRGNARTSGEQRRKEKDGVFGEGSRATVSISLLVKNPDAAQHGVLHYRDIGDYLTRKQKLGLIAEYGSVDGVSWDVLDPNEAGDWLDQRDAVFGSFRTLSERTGPGVGIFSAYSGGLKTNRDAWVFNASRECLEANAERTISFFNSQAHSATGNGPVTEDSLDRDTTKISWSSSLIPRALRRDALGFDRQNCRVAAYRPFNKQWLYFSADLNDRRGILPKIFPRADRANLGIFVISPGETSDFASLVTDAVPDLHYLATGQFFPRYTYEARSEQPSLFDDGEPYTRVDNITDEIVAEYRALYGSQTTKDDIFYFVYGLLHSPDYRTTYAADLKKMLPRIPKLSAASDFWAFAKAGRELADLHLEYESVEPYPLEIVVSRRPRAASSTTNAVAPSLVEERREERAARLETPAPNPSASDLTGVDLRVEKTRFGGKAGAWDKSTIRYNDQITLSGIPPETHEYLLGSRSALEWILERYQVKTD
ncbi:DEAD/DEAH box helicase [Rathayibacter soli]|uniref:DEAD/DEAH box helicase n=1 Tax=Rathayibacter soli TaxID=3144168 RepID=UPI0027E589A7|nr:type ISP restriction/modification enzyme [Glaciibacter superstes]